MPVSIQDFNSIIFSPNANKSSLFAALITTHISESENPNSIIPELTTIVLSLENAMLEDLLKSFSAVLLAMKTNDENKNKPTLQFGYKLIVDIIERCIVPNTENWNLARNILSWFNTFPEIAQQVNNNLLLIPSYSKIIPAIKFMNSLPITALERISRSIPVADFEKLLSNLNEEADKQALSTFITNLRLYQTKIILSNAWSVGDDVYLQNIHGEVELAGTSIDLNRRELIDSMELVSKNIDELIDAIMGQTTDLSKTQLAEIITEAIQNIVALQNPQQNQQLDPTYFSEHQNQIVISHLSLVEFHALSCAFWKDKFCIFSRSSEGEKVPNGIRVFTIPEDIKAQLLYVVKNGTTQNKIEELLAALNPTLYPMKPQSAANCAWIATKAMIWFAFYFNTLSLINKQQISTSEPPETLAAIIARVSYKKFSTIKRMQVLDAYLENTTVDQKDADGKLLKDIHGKGVKKGLAMRFSPPEHPKSDKVDAPQQGLERRGPRLT